MLRLYHILLCCAIVMLLPVGVKLARPPVSSASKLQLTQTHVDFTGAQTTAPKPKTDSGTPTTLNPTEENIWNNVLGKTAAPPNWRVAPCEGKVSLLCVSSKEGPLGTVEMGVYPLGQQLDFQKMLVAAGIPLRTKVDYQNPKYQAQVSAALKAWIEKYYAALSEDRQVSYGKSITFIALSPQQVPIGKLPGMRYGFVGRKPQGGVFEQNLGYVAFDGSTLYVITTAFNPALETGKFETIENFQLFESHLSAIVATLKLPT
ncbi:MAG: hypothetical protein DSM106950_12695 [Stigonema ocellatum SAG 48.90 = DSM 106950]|nr:hypothetical protein [Stigonema ocellatum SAG 48.90 = DSM 106950]